MTRPRRLPWMALAVLLGLAALPMAPANAEPAATPAAVPPAEVFCGFLDVPYSSFYTDASCWLKDEGITTGAGTPTRYAPAEGVNRAQMAAFLWRRAGSPATDSSCGFIDEANIPAYARSAVCWLKSEGLTNNNPYRAENPVTRAQMAAFLHRAAGSPPAVNRVFRDEALIPPYARVATYWLFAQGITVADPYKPNDTVTRNQMAAFLWRDAGRPAVDPIDGQAFELWFNTTRSPGRTVTLPLGPGAVSIDWGDLGTDTVTGPADVSHTYAAEGYYRVRITGSLDSFGGFRRQVSNMDKLVAVPSFGAVGLDTIEWAFGGARNLVRVPTSLPEGTDSLEGTFGDPGLLTTIGPVSVDEADVLVAPAATLSDELLASDLSTWDTSNITDISYMFAGKSTFNQDISRWDTSNVTTMTHMFYYASSFNQDLSGWDTSNVTDMSYTFYDAISFNGDVSTWNTANVRTMERMFQGAESFNQPVGNWNLANVTTIEGMFQGISSSTGFLASSVFNQPLSNWNTSNITNMEAVFHGAVSFNQNISGWNTANVTRVYYMFNEALSFNQNLSSWNVSKITRAVDRESFDFLAESWTLPRPNFIV